MLYVYQMDFMRDAAVFITGRQDGSISFWDVSATTLYSSVLDVPKFYVAGPKSKQKSINQLAPDEKKQIDQAIARRASLATGKLRSEQSKSGGGGGGGSSVRWVPNASIHTPGVGAHMHTANVHSDQVTRLRQIPMRSALSVHELLVSSSWDKTIAVSALDFDPEENSIRVNRLNQYGRGSSEDCFTHGVYDMCVVGTSHDWIVGGTFGKALVMDVDSAQCVAIFSETDMWAVNALCPIDHLQLLAVGSMDAKIRLYDMRSPPLIGAVPTQVMEQSPSDGGITTLTYLPNHQLLSCSVFGNLCMWDLRMISNKKPTAVWHQQCTNSAQAVTSGTQCYVI